MPYNNPNAFSRLFLLILYFALVVIVVVSQKKALSVVYTRIYILITESTDPPLHPPYPAHLY